MSFFSDKAARNFVKVAVDGYFCTMTEAYIFEALRTPRGIGTSRGALYEVRPVAMLATLLQALEERLPLDSNLVDDVIIGCTAPIDDQGHNIARAGSLYASWSDRIGGIQLHRFGTSGLEAINLAAAKIRSGWEQLIVAGGLESMSRVPAASDGGPLLYDPELINALAILPAGIAADLLATREGFDRTALDAVALRSWERARQAQQAQRFQRSIVPITDRNGLPLLAADEWLQTVAGDPGLEALEPAFAQTGRSGFDAMALHRFPELEGIHHLHTLGNSARAADGAALVVVGSKEQGKAVGLQPRARIRAAAATGVDPTLRLTGTVTASRRALDLAGMTPQDIDLWECNECFAAVTLKFQRDIDIDDDRLNVNGGAIALGHPLGATGAMLLGTILNELERRDLTTGLVTITGNGTGAATIIERT